MKSIKKFQSLRAIYHSNPSPMDTKEGLRLQKEMRSVRGWRGLFDCYAHEFKYCNLEQKAAILEKMQEFFKCGLDKLVWLYAKDCFEDEYHHYRLDGIPEAIYLLASVYRPAEQYLMACKHPMFRRFNKSQLKHWKTAIEGNLAFPDYLEVNESNLGLFLLS